MSQGLLEKLGLVVILVFVLLDLKLPFHIKVDEAICQLVLFEEICKFDQANFFVIVLSPLLPGVAFVKFIKGADFNNEISIFTPTPDTLRIADSLSLFQIVSNVILPTITNGDI